MPRPRGLSASPHLRRKLSGPGGCSSQNLLRRWPLANCVEDSLSCGAWGFQLLWHWECSFWPLGSRAARHWGEEGIPLKPQEQRSDLGYSCIQAWPQILLLSFYKLLLVVFAVGM